MYFFRDFKDIVRLLTEVLGMFRRLAEQDGRQKETDGGRVLPSSEKRRIATGVQAFFEKNYDLRYNVMKQTEEFRRKAPPGNSKALIGEGKALIAEEVALIGNYYGLIASLMTRTIFIRLRYIRRVFYRRGGASSLKCRRG